jgi:3-phenylpropionate/trans-cinnamate dioxygenase ferredoxin subunit
MVQQAVARTADIPPGTNKVVTVRGREIVIFNVGGEFFAFLNRCPHEGAKLCHGVLVGLTESDSPGSYSFQRKGEMLRCPWHGWEFDIRTGKSWFDPERIKLRGFPVWVGDDQASDSELEQIVAETFPVKSIDDFVIVDV